MTDQLWVLILAVFAAGGAAGTVFYILGKRAERRAAEDLGQTVAQRAEQVLEQARRDAASAKQEAVLNAKQDVLKLREAWEAEAKTLREELDRHEERLEERESLIDRKLNALDDQRQQAVALAEVLLVAGELLLQRP